MEKLKNNRLDGVADSLSLIVRLFKIKELIARKQLKNKEEILNALGDKSGSESTLKRDLKKLESLGYYCSLDRKAGFWKVNCALNEGESEQKEIILALANQSIELAEVMREELSERDNISLEFELSKRDLLKLFFRFQEWSAKSQIVSFDYKPAIGEVKKVNILPRLVAERNNRLYVIGFRLDKMRDQVYSLDRILGGKVGVGSISLKREQDIKIPVFSKKAWFSQIVGISNEDAEILDIELLYTTKQALYMREYPIHPNEKLIYDDENGRCIQVKLKNTYELRAKILELGAGVKVLKPEILRKQIKETLQQILKTYEL